MREVVGDLVGSLEYIESQQSALMEEKVQLQSQLAGMEAKLRDLNRDHIKYKAKSENLDNHSRRNNIIIKGIPEGWHQNIEEVVRSFLVDYFGVPYSVGIDGIRRLGRFFRRHDGSIRSRPIIVLFSLNADRENVWNLRRNLQGSRYSLDEDYAPETQAVRRKLFPVMAEAKRKKLGRKIELIKDTLHIDGFTYTIDTLHNLPKEVRDGSRWTESQVSFFGELCPASNFHPATFNHNGKEVENSEKMLFYKKAKLFNDEFTAKRIEKESDPRVIKNLSKSIQGVNEDQWTSQIKKLVTPILYDKFRQNPPLLKWLKLTGNRTLVEAAGPHDKVWGNGLFLSDDNNTNRSRWSGENLQGQMLMEVRAQLCPESIFPEPVQKLLKLGHDDDGNDDMDDETAVDLPASQGFNMSTSPETSPQRDRTSSFHVQFDAPSTSTVSQVQSKS